MDNGLVLELLKTDNAKVECLNPCCSGQWSRTYRANVMLRKTVS